MSRVLMVASEAIPFSKTGGLADVLGALPAALQERGDEVAVVLPLYRTTSRDGLRLAGSNMRVWMGNTQYGFDVYQADRAGVPYFLVDAPAFFDRAGIYVEDGQEYRDNWLRFGLLCQAALDVARYLFRPHVLHLHDWQAGLVAPYLRHSYDNDPTFYGMKLVFTIHNLGYQGIYPRETMAALSLPAALFRTEGLEYYRQINFLKAGLVYSHHLTTVSQGYAREIQTPEYGFGLDGVLRDRADRLTGILNGVDYKEWSPELDRHLAAPYSADDLTGKKRCKTDLLAAFGLPDAPKRPLLGIVSRLATQKGFDLVSEIIQDVLKKQDVGLVGIGTGEPQYERFFLNLAAAHPDRVGFQATYNDALAHKIEGGADLFLMPSRYEPCGLNQIYSLRYGTIPVVRATGGLDDTIKDAPADRTGFKFKEYTGAALAAALDEALTAYQNQEEWTRMMQRAMAQDFSWAASAAQYSNLYRRLRARVRT